MMEHQVEMWRTFRRIVTLVAIIGGVWWLIVRPVERLVVGTRATVESGLSGLRQALGAITHTETRITEGRAEIIQTQEISELALLEMRMSTTRSIEKTENYSFIPLGTKKLMVRGFYQIKGGYKLTDGISLHMENGTPVACFPEPQILSVELVDFDVLSEDSGWLNKIQPADRAQILRELRSQMRVEAEQSGLLTTVEMTLRTRLRDLLGAESVTIQRAIP